MHDDVHAPALPGTRTFKKDTHTVPEEVSGVSFTVPQEHIAHVGEKPTQDPQKKTGSTFDVEHALGDSAIEEGTIITDKKQDHVEARSILAKAWDEWWRGTRKSFAPFLESLKQKEKVTIAPAEERAHIIKEAAQFSPQAPRDDHQIVVGKVKIQPHDPEISPIPQYFLKQKEHIERVWSHTEAEPKTAPAGTPSAEISAPIINTSLAKSATRPYVIPNVSVQPTERQISKSPLAQTGKNISQKVPPLPPQQKREDGAPEKETKFALLRRNYTKDDEDEEEITEKSHAAEKPAFLRPFTLNEKTDVQEEVALPEKTDAVLVSPISEVPNISVQPVVQQSIIPPSIPHVPTPIPTILDVPSEPIKPQDDTQFLEITSAPAAVIEEMLDDMTLKQPQPPLREINAEIQKERHEEGIHAIVEEDLSAQIPVQVSPAPMSYPEPPAVSQKPHIETAPLRHTPTVGTPLTPKVHSYQFVGIILIVVCGVIGGVGAAVIYGPTLFTKNPTPLTQSVIPSYLHGHENVVIPLPDTKEQFLDTLTEKVASTQTGIVQYYLVRDDMSASSEAIFMTLNTHAPASFLRTVDSHTMFGGIRLESSAEPFIIIRVRNFDTAFAGMLTWESSLSADLTPLFGPEVLSTRTPREKVASNVPYFTDVLSGNRAVRVLYDETGKERVTYAFLKNESLLIITTTTKSLEALISAVP